MPTSTIAILSLLLAGAAQAAPPAAAASSAGAEPKPAAAEAPAAPAPAAGTDAKAAAAPATAPAQAAATKAEPQPEAAPVGPETFDDGVALHYAGEFRDAAPHFFRYVAGSSRTADNFEWAEYFLAEDLAKLGFSHAALVFLAEVAKTRASADVLPVALESLERLTAQGFYDEELVEREVLGGTDFGFLPPAINDYVRFHKGLIDYRNGGLRWAWGHFDKISDASPYRARARLVRAVHSLQAEGATDAALAELEAMAADEAAPREVRNEARIAAARLWFEKGDWQKAHARYDAVDLPELDPGRGQIYLEKAWTYYRTGDASRAMGLLLALEAPSFRELFLPEKYVLAALVYKDRCHYLPAKRAARGFVRRYGSALRLVRERGRLESDPRLLAAAVQLDPAARRADGLVQRLTGERELIDAYASRFEGSGLTARLRQIYERALAEATRQRESALTRALEAAADRLLREEEQVRLLDYEIGLELYKRVKKGALADAAAPADESPGSEAAVYPFDGEYWNDELMDFRMQLPSRCASAEAER